MRKKAWQGVWLGAASGILALFVHHLGWLNGWEAGTWSWRVRYFARSSEPSDLIRVILLDQTSLDWGKNENGLSWQWPRQVYVPILKFCARAGVRAVAFDVLYTEPSAYGKEDDALLGTAIAEVPAFVGAVFLSDKSGDATVWPTSAPPPRFTKHFEIADDCRAQVASLQTARGVFPIPELATRATLLGNVSDEPDADGVFRRVRGFRWFDGQAVPSLGIATFLAAEMARGEDAPLQWIPGCVRIGDYRIPVDDRLRMLLRYVGSNGMHKTYNAAAIIRSELQIESGEKPEVDPADLKDRYVLFGFSAPGLLDLRVTPISKVYPGVQIHATQLDNLLHQRFLRDPRPWIVWAGHLLMAMAAGFAGRLCKRWWHSVGTFVIGLPVPLLLGFAGYAFGVWWPVVVGELGIGLALLGAVVWNYATEGRQKAFIKQAFKHYISPDYIELLLENPDQLKLGGEKKQLSIFFSDLQGFSSFSEKLDPVALTEFLNEYLTDMTDIIQEECGTLDKYEGDAIIAFWNAPVTLPDHAVRACRAALRCQRRLAERNPEFASRYGHELRMRVGIHTGPVVVGNMGSRERFNYTILGDAANLASRLEGANKAFGTYLMISEDTWQQSMSAFAGRCLGKIRVVGRQTPVRVFEILGFSGDPLPPFLGAYERGFAWVEKREWRKALDEFAKAGTDPVSRKYAERCRELIERSELWDGVWNLTAK